MSELKPHLQRFQTRRHFLSGALTAISLLNIGCNDLRPQPIPGLMTPGPSPEPSVSPIPAVATAEVQLQATATVLAERRVDNSFQESMRFSREFFDQVRDSTVLLEFENASEIRKGTGWIAQIDDESVYFATARHAFQNAKNTLNQISFYNSGLNRSKTTLSQVKYAYEGPDVAIIKCAKVGKIMTALKPLNWLDRYTPPIGGVSLLVGYPAALSENRPANNSLIMGSEARNVWNRSETEWIARAIVGLGESGSPVVINKDGTPLVIGAVAALTSATFLEKDINKEEIVTIVNSLNLNKLIKLVDN